jgi:hypothetical protein
MGLSVATRVDALEARGRLLEAIDLLRAGCEADDVEAAQRLLQLRRAAFDRLPRDTASTRWPPTTADPFPGLTGPPELSADEVNADTVGGSILHHGSLIVRGFAEPAVAAELADGIERTFVAIDAWREAGRKRDATSQWFTPFVDKPAMREWVRAGGGVWAVESPIVAERIFDMYRTIGMRDILAAYFSEAPAVSCEKLTLRKVGPDAVPSWHQDGSFMGDAVRSVNVWIALTDCGGDAPDRNVRFDVPQFHRACARGTRRQYRRHRPTRVPGRRCTALRRPARAPQRGERRYDRLPLRRRVLVLLRVEVPDGLSRTRLLSSGLAHRVRRRLVAVRRGYAAVMFEVAECRRARLARDRASSNGSA